MSKEHYAILYLDNPDKDQSAFWKTLKAYRKDRGDDFNRMVFAGTADFSNEVFEGPVSFLYAKFYGKANFYEATFEDKANFYEATFEDKANFFSATFEDKANFYEATFKDKASFSWATFKDKASFFSATFKDKANFQRATFKDMADFFSATFKDKASFFSATFKDKASFFSATFKDKANFYEATFEDQANFQRATFEDQANFISATFKDQTNFQRATFAQMVGFSWATFKDKANFYEATFKDMADFSGAIFNGLALFSGTIENPIFKDQRVGFLALSLEPLNAITFRNADLSRARFLDTDLRQIEFTSVNWKQKGNQDKLGDEDFEYEDPKPYGKLERAYRELKQNHEDRKDFPRAGRFHFREKEMRRLNKDDTPLGTRLLLLLYKYLGGYGERIAPPLIAFLLLIFFCLAFYGFPEIGGLWAAENYVATDKADTLYLHREPMKFFRYSMETALLLRPRDLVPATTFSEMVRLVEMILGPVFLGLLALSIRQRVKR